MGENWDLLFKLIVIGDTGTGPLFPAHCRENLPAPSFRHRQELALKRAVRPR